MLRARAGVGELLVHRLLGNDERGASQKLATPRYACLAAKGKHAQQSTRNKSADYKRLEKFCATGYKQPRENSCDPQYGDSQAAFLNRAAGQLACPPCVVRTRLHTIHSAGYTGTS